MDLNFNPALVNLAIAYGASLEDLLKLAGALLEKEDLLKEEEEEEEE